MGRESWSTTGIFFNPRFFIVNQILCNRSLGWQRTTARVMTVDTAIAQLDP